VKTFLRNGTVLALALTWDGARWPVQTLPAKARTFLGKSTRRIPSARKTAKLFIDDQVTEMRICWMPRLKGGSEVLSGLFRTPAEKRIGFRMMKTVRFGDILGVVYRRT
jgi:hypothetical protein